MPDAVLRVSSVGPLVSLQDAGRPGFARFGVPASGPMDPLGHAVANVAAQNAPDATAIEVSLGGVELECIAGPITVGVAGGGFNVSADLARGGGGSSWAVQTLRIGDLLRVEAGEWGSWAYVALGGTVDSQRWLGSSATHSMSGKGGGGLSVGDEILVRNAQVSPELDIELPVPTFAQPSGQVRVVMGPQEAMFVAGAAETLLGSPFELTNAFDRMGVRLLGPALHLADVLSIPSEPAMQGSIQVAGDGVATVLFADHQTTGGYPKIATVISTDLAQLVQARPSERVRFTAVTPAEAITAVRQRQDEWSSYLDKLAQPNDTVAERLRTLNLITPGHLETGEE